MKRLILTLLALAPSGYLVAANANASASAVASAGPETDAKAADGKQRAEQEVIVPDQIKNLLDYSVKKSNNSLYDWRCLLPGLQGKELEDAADAHDNWQWQLAMIQLGYWLDQNPHVHKNAKMRPGRDSFTLLYVLIEDAYDEELGNPIAKRLLLKLLQLEPSVSAPEEGTDIREHALWKICRIGKKHGPIDAAQIADAKKIVELMLSQGASMDCVDRILNRVLAMERMDSTPHRIAQAVLAHAKQYDQSLKMAPQAAVTFLAQEGILDRDTARLMKQYLVPSAANNNPTNAASAKK